MRCWHAGLLHVRILSMRGDGEVRYVFTYHSTGVSSSVLILIRTVREELLCEFLTRGHVAEPHGEWSLDSMRLQVWFHDHFCDEDSLMMPVSPTTFYRDRADPNDWIQDSDDQGIYLV